MILLFLPYQAAAAASDSRLAHFLFIFTSLQSHLIQNTLFIITFWWFSLSSVFRAASPEGSALLSLWGMKLMQKKKLKRYCTNNGRILIERFNRFLYDIGLFFFVALYKSHSYVIFFQHNYMVLQKYWETGAKSSVRLFF